jgi:hypothetical protein
MKYAKPELLQHGSAVSVVQLVLEDKGMDTYFDRNPGWLGWLNATIGAYDADE